MRRFINDMYGFTSMSLHRDQGITKKAAWRRLMQFRIAMANEEEPEVFSGTVEADETFVGGKGQRYPKSRSTGLYLPKEKRKSGRATDNTAVFGMKERGSRRVHAKIMPFDEKGKRLASEQLYKEFEIKCESGTIIITDEYSGYKALGKPPKVDLSLLDDSLPPPPSYEHHTVCHKDGRFTAGPGIHTNGIEGFWSRLKGSFDTYRKTPDKYMQHYIDEVCFRQNTLDIRGTQEEFDLLLKRCVLK